jgi:hypothetical protein
MILRATMAVIAVVLFLGGLAGSKQPANAQSGLEPTVEALTTQVAALQTAVANLQNKATSPSQTPIPTVENGGTASAVPESGGDGLSLASPLPLGMTAHVGDYDVRILAFDENETVHPGEVTVALEFTYLGTESGTLWIDLNFNAIGEQGLSYSTIDEEHNCEDGPSSLFHAPEMFPGATYAADICWLFPDEEAENLVIEVTPSFDFNNGARYFALR